MATSYPEALTETTAKVATKFNTGSPYYFIFDKPPAHKLGLKFSYFYDRTTNSFTTPAISVRPLLVILDTDHDLMPFETPEGDRDRV